MNTRFDNRTALTQLIERMEEPDIKQVMAFAAGYEAGRISSLQEHGEKIRAQVQPEKPSV